MSKLPESRLNTSPVKASKPKKPKANYREGQRGGQRNGNSTQGQKPAGQSRQKKPSSANGNNAEANSSRSSAKPAGAQSRRRKPSPQRSANPYGNVNT